MKEAVINFRTTADRKQRLKKAAAETEGYTMTRLLEEGADMVLEKVGGKREQG
jgi:uncharacterized protein (DUF1778 family)